jgi:hypothetical protein
MIRAKKNKSKKENKEEEEEKKKSFGCGSRRASRRTA